MPGAFNDSEKQRFLTNIARGRRPATTAEHMGYAWTTVSGHLKKDPEFAAAFQDALRVVDERVEEALLDQAEEGNMSAIKFWLTNRRSESWSDLTKTQVIGGGGSTTTTINIAIATTDNWRAVLADPESREAALSFAQQIPAIEAKATERD